MNNNSTKPTDKLSLADINKKIVEIKKKIQLSEGQRKAAFEEYEAERKSNADQILKLKKEITELTVSLQINRDSIAANKVKSMRLETILGPLKQRTMKQLITTLDLQNIDLKKQLDLVRHKKNQRQTYMTKLTHQYQILLSDKPNIEVKIKIDNPFKRKIVSLQNNIHRVEMQWREAEHVKKSYRNIRTRLLGDAGKFESKIKHLEEQYDIQQRDIQQLQKINAEAAKTRSQARGTLEREEKTALNAGKIRERQEAEYTRLVSDRKLELERLERKIFQSGKAPARPDTADDISQTDQEEATPTEDQEQVLKEAFEKLKEATGATSTQEVLLRFRSQKDTRKRLEYLRRNTELEKRQLELNQNKLTAELEKYKYAQELDKDKTGDNITRLKDEIKTQEDLQDKAEKDIDQKKIVLQSICRALYSIYISLREIGIKPQPFIRSDVENGERVISALHIELTKVVDVLENRESVENDESEMIEQVYTEEMLLPQTYNVLLRRTPVLPTQVGVAVVVGSDDEEEVPSRGFLKRQAQLVVDAKSRRKNIRVPSRK